MSNKKVIVTVSGDSDPQRPVCGGDIVPVSPRSSSHNGLVVTATGKGEGAQSSAPPPPLRLRRGGPIIEGGSRKKDREGKKDEGMEPAMRLRPEPRSWSLAVKETKKGKGGKGGGTGSVVRNLDADFPPLDPRGVPVVYLGPPVTLQPDRGSRRDEESASGGRSSSSPMSWGASTASAKRTHDKRGEGVKEVSSLDNQSPASSSSSSQIPVVKRRRDWAVERWGRPAKDAGEYTADKKDTEEKRMEEREEAILGHPNIRASARAEDRNAHQIMADMREAPTASITQLGLDAVERIKKVATTLRNMKGAYVGILWRAIEDLTAHNMIMTIRAQAPNTDVESERRATELEVLRKEISSLRTNEALLQAQVRALREVVGKPSGGVASIEKGEKAGTSSGRGKRAGRKNYVPPSDTSSDEEMMQVDRGLSSKETGRRARDIERGTVPRPPNQGEKRGRRGGGLTCLGRAAPGRLPPYIGGEGADRTAPGLDEIVHVVIKTLSTVGLLASPAAPVAQGGGG